MEDVFSERGPLYVTNYEDLGKLGNIKFLSYISKHAIFFYEVYICIILKLFCQKKIIIQCNGMDWGVKEIMIVKNNVMGCWEFIIVTLYCNLLGWRYSMNTCFKHYEYTNQNKHDEYPFSSSCWILQSSMINTLFKHDEYTNQAFWIH